MTYNFSDYKEIIERNSVKIILSEEEYKKIEVFSSNVAKAKIKEKHHQIDNRKEHKRYMTGFLGEAALEKLLGISVIDWSIGDSKNFHVPDIKKYNIGIKTVEYGKFPIIFQKNTYPQIICIISPNDPMEIYVMGIATEAVLNQYQSTDIIIDKNILTKNSKTGFYGLDKIKKISSLTDIEEYCKHNKICPRCHGIMKKRNGKYGEFWGCSNYPKCNHTENI